MPKFIVEETVPTWITYRAEVEANSEDEAVAMFKSEQPQGYDVPLWGDVVEGVPVQLEVNGQPYGFRFTARHT